MAYDEDIADAESIGDEEDYEDDEYDDEEEEYLFGTIPRTPGLIAIAAVSVALILIIAALVSSSFGFVGGIDSMNVTIQGSEGQIYPFLDENLDIEAQANPPAFGRNANGNGDLVIHFDDGINDVQEVYTGDFKFNNGRGSRSVPYEEFYVDNGEYRAEIIYEGVSESATIVLKRTAHDMVIVQTAFTMYDREQVLYKISLLPDEGEDSTADVLYTPGEGYIQVYYVDDEAEQDDDQKWEKVWNISIVTDFEGFEYTFPGDDTQNLSSNEGYQIIFDAVDLLDEKEVDEGYFSIEVGFVNKYGLVDKGAFTNQITAFPEDKGDSSRWIYLERDDE